MALGSIVKGLDIKVQGHSVKSTASQMGISPAATGRRMHFPKLPKVRAAFGRSFDFDV
jgi:hypothetical protein